MISHNFIKLKVLRLSNLGALGTGIDIILIAKNIRKNTGLKDNLNLNV